MFIVMDFVMEFVELILLRVNYKFIYFCVYSLSCGYIFNPMTRLRENTING